MNDNEMFYKYLDRLQYMDQLIRQQRTGNATEFGRKLGLSRRQVYNLLEELRLLGIELEYNRSLKSFIYLKSYKINIELNISEIADSEAIGLKAGLNFLLKSSFCAIKLHKDYLFLKY